MAVAIAIAGIALGIAGCGGGSGGSPTPTPTPSTLPTLSSAGIAATKTYLDTKGSSVVSVDKLAATLSTKHSVAQCQVSQLALNTLGSPTHVSAKNGAAPDQVTAELAFEEYVKLGQVLEACTQANPVDLSQLNTVRGLLETRLKTLGVSQ